MIWLIISYGFILCYFLIYKFDAEETIRIYKINSDYYEEKNRRLKAELDKIYSQIDKVRKS